MDLFEIKIKNGLPFINATRELIDFDMSPITEKENSIMFILDDDPWEFHDGFHTMKLRLRHAGELDSQIRELKEKRKIKLNDIHWVHLATICKVYKTSSMSEVLKDDLSKQLYEKSVKEIQTAIDEFNMISLMKGMEG